MDLQHALAETRILAVLRGDDAAGVVAAGQVLAEAGVVALEVTYTVPDAGRAITALRERLPDRLVGAGTVTTADEVTRAVDAGAQFVVSPGSPPALLEPLLGCGVPALPGVLTPGEVMAATAAGATTVKLFPAAVGGTRYLAQLLGPFPRLQVVPTGGIGVEEVDRWLIGGAVAVGLSTALCSPEDIRRRDWGLVTERARTALRAAVPA